MFPYIPVVKAGIGGLGPWELGVVLLVVLVVFGAGKLPTVGSSLGESIKNFKKAMKEGEPKENETTPPTAQTTTVTKANDSTQPKG